MKFGAGILYRKSLSRREICDTGLCDGHTIVSFPQCPHLFSVLGEIGCRQSAVNAVDRLRLARKSAQEGRKWDCTCVLALKPCDVLHVKNAMVENVCRITERTMCSLALFMKCCSGNDSSSGKCLLYLAAAIVAVCQPGRLAGPSCVVCSIVT
jgi:hypothetical protein